MTEKTWAKLRVLFLIPIGAILALLWLYRNDGVPWWVLAIMLLHTGAVLWLIWMRMKGLRVDRGDRDV